MILEARRMFMACAAALSAATLAPVALADSGAPSDQSAAASAAAQSMAPAPAAPAGRVGPAPAGKAQIVFFRPGAFAGMALSFSIHEGATGVGKLGNGSYFVYVGDPGPHTFTIQSEATDTLHMELDPGETYYVKQTIGMGIMVGRPHMTPSDQATFDGMPSLHLSTKKPSDLDPASVHTDDKPAHPVS
jgi:hypothetical protein